jgi:hypothetical protein
MNPPRHKYGAPGRYGPAPAQGKLSLNGDGHGATKLEKRLAEDPELLRRIAEFAQELGGNEDRVVEEQQTTA